MSGILNDAFFKVGYAMPSSESSSLVPESIMVLSDRPYERRWLNDGENKAFLDSSEEILAMRSVGSIVFKYLLDRSMYLLNSCILGGL